MINRLECHVVLFVQVLHCHENLEFYFIFLRSFLAWAGCRVCVMMPWRHPVDANAHDRQLFILFYVLYDLYIVQHHSEPQESSLSSLFITGKNLQMLQYDTFRPLSAEKRLWKISFFLSLWNWSFVVTSKFESGRYFIFYFVFSFLRTNLTVVLSILV